MNREQIQSDNTPTQTALSRVAVWVLCVTAALYALTAVVALALTDWSTLFARSEFNQVVVIVPVVLGWLLAMGAFVALPVALSREIWMQRRLANGLAYALAGLCIAAIPVSGWPAVPASVVFFAISVGVIWRLGAAFEKQPWPMRRYSVSLGYVLLVAGGPWGLHDYYLSRSWAGILKAALLLLGTLALGSFFTYVFLAVLTGLLIYDAGMLPRRVDDLRGRVRARVKI